MVRNLEHLHSDIFSVRAKERELRGAGYRLNTLTDASQLAPDEYILRTPIRQSSAGNMGWHYMSILWRTS